MGIRGDNSVPHGYRANKALADALKAKEAAGKPAVKPNQEGVVAKTDRATAAVTSLAASKPDAVVKLDPARVKRVSSIDSKKEKEPAVASAATRTQAATVSVLGSENTIGSAGAAAAGSVKEPVVAKPNVALKKEEAPNPEESIAKMRASIVKTYKKIFNKAEGQVKSALGSYGTWIGRSESIDVNDFMQTRFYGSTKSSREKDLTSKNLSSKEMIASIERGLKLIAQAYGDSDYQMAKDIEKLNEQLEALSKLADAHETPLTQANSEYRYVLDQFIGKRGFLEPAKGVKGGEQELLKLQNYVHLKQPTQKQAQEVVKLIRTVLEKKGANIGVSSPLHAKLNDVHLDLDAFEKRIKDLPEHHPRLKESFGALFRAGGLLDQKRSDGVIIRDYLTSKNQLDRFMELINGEVGVEESEKALHLLEEAFVKSFKGVFGWETEGELPSKTFNPKIAGLMQALRGEIQAVRRTPEAVKQVQDFFKEQIHKDIKVGSKITSIAKHLQGLGFKAAFGATTRYDDLMGLIQKGPKEFTKDDALKLYKAVYVALNEIHKGDRLEKLEAINDALGPFKERLVILDGIMHPNRPAGDFENTLNLSLLNMKS